MLFRGPKADRSGPHVLYFGGTATYGKFVPRPFPALVEARTHLRSVNLGVVNSGPDLYLRDAGLLAMTGGASVTVVQITGALNMTNRYYSVHPRRNDRFLWASPLLRTIFRDADFTGYHFTSHMLQGLQDLAPQSFARLVEDLQKAWVERMTTLLSAIRGPVALLWLADRAMPDTVDVTRPIETLPEPLFVTRPMVEALRSHAARLVEVAASPAALALGSAGMVYSQMEAAAAQSQLGVPVQMEAAEALIPVIRDLAPHPRQARQT